MSTYRDENESIAAENRRLAAEVARLRETVLWRQRAWKWLGTYGVFVAKYFVFGIFLAFVGYFSYTLTKMVSHSGVQMQIPAVPQELHTGGVRYTTITLESGIQEGSIDTVVFQPSSLDASTRIYHVTAVVVSPPTGGGSVEMVCGTTPGGADLMRSHVISLGTAIGTTMNISLAELRGTRFEARTAYQAVLPRGAPVICRMYVFGRLTSGATVHVSVAGTDS